MLATTRQWLEHVAKTTNQPNYVASHRILELRKQPDKRVVVECAHTGVHDAWIVAFFLSLFF